MNPRLEVRRIDAGLDWLTFTIPYRVWTRQEADLVDDIMRSELEGGSWQKKWAGLGYQGLTCGGLTVGRRSDGMILQARGPLATSFATRLLTTFGHSTRVDLSTTFWLKAPLPSLGRYLQRGTQTECHRSGRPPKRSFITNDAGSFTCNIGRRSNGKVLRIYDKGVEKGTAEPGLIWRVELELGGPFAEQACQDLRDTQDHQSVYSHGGGGGPGRGPHAATRSRLCGSRSGTHSRRM
jgi:hypothetical protein